MPSNQVSVEANVCRAFAVELCCEPSLVQPESELAALPGLDSVKLLRVIAALETEYGVGLDDDLLYDLKTVSGVMALVESELSFLAPVCAPDGQP